MDVVVLAVVVVNLVVVAVVPVDFAGNLVVVVVNLVGVVAVLVDFAENLVVVVASFVDFVVADLETVAVDLVVVLDQEEGAVLAWLFLHFPSFFFLVPLFLAFVSQLSS